MQTKIAFVEEEHINKRVIKEAGQILKRGGLVAFPTETVYGLGGDALKRESARRIYAAKGRPSDNPLIVHICRWAAINRIVKRIPAEAERLAAVFWPGPLTMILEKSELVPPETTGGLSTVAVRMPENKTALALIRAGGGYIAAPSANTSGKPSPTRASHVIEDLEGKIEMILDGGEVGIGLESTIVDLTEGRPVILRPGYITKEMLEQALSGQVDVDRAILGEKQAPKAPGMKYRHYAPKGELVIVDGEADKVQRTIRRLSAEKMKSGWKVGIICTEETKKGYRADRVVSVGARADEEAAAKHLYAALRDFDAEGIGMIYSESFPDKGIGQAVMNRLLKAAGHQVLKV